MEYNYPKMPGTRGSRACRKVDISLSAQPTDGEKSKVRLKKASTISTVSKRHVARRTQSTNAEKLAHNDSELKPVACEMDRTTANKRKSDGELPKKSAKKFRQTKKVMVDENVHVDVKYDSSMKLKGSGARHLQNYESSSSKPSDTISGKKCQRNRQSTKTQKASFLTLPDKETVSIGDSTFEMKTEDSSCSDSDSEFEEVQSQYRAPELSTLSSVHSDSGICRKREESFSDLERFSGTSSSVGLNVNDVTNLSSPSSFAARSDSGMSSSDRSKKTAATKDKGKLVQKEKNARKKSGNKRHSESDQTEKNPVRKHGSKRHSDETEKNLARKHGSKRHSDETEKNSGRKHGSKSQSYQTAKKTGSKSQSNDSKKKTGKKKPSASLSPKKETLMGSGDGDIMALLMQMEGRTTRAPDIANQSLPSTSGHSSSGKKLSSRKRTKRLEDSNGESDWEEVEDYEHSPIHSQIPDAPVEITIDDPGMMMHKKRKKKEFDWEAYVQRRINRLAKEIQVDMHKVHLLCLLSGGLQQNAVCRDVTLCAIALSIVPLAKLKKAMARFDPVSLLQLVQWFRSIFSLTKGEPSQECRSLVGASSLVKAIENKSTDEARQLVMVLVAVLRAMGFNVRLVMALCPLPLKTSHAAAGTSKTAAKGKKTGSAESKESSSKKSISAGCGHEKAAKSSNPKPSKSMRGSNTSMASKPTNKGNEKTKTESKRKQAPKKAKEESSSSSESESGNERDRQSDQKRPASVRPTTNVKPSACKKKRNGSDVGSQPSSGSDGSNFSEEEEVVKKKAKHSSKGKGKALAQKSTKKSDVDGEESGGEFDETFKVNSPIVQGGAKRKANRKVVSPDTSPDRLSEHKLKSGRDYWLEVYLPADEKWICVDCIRSVVNKPYDICGAASQPLLYVLGFDNDGNVKDVTARYAPQWLTHTRKQRVDSAWWREALEPLASSNQALDDQENESIAAFFMKRPLPSSIGDFKNHPLYALERHLLKYEALYPESSIPVGYVRNEPVYARECVHTLHSRNNWLKEARIVRLGEYAYKMVKSIKRWGRGRDMNPAPDEPDLELFGRWQTEDYIPPPAVDGKVPKNEYGNVELFQPSMLPGGTVHVRVPALNRVAKKLGIDVAAAMTGWDNHCGFSHPVLDGWIVCEEHKDILLAAWEEDQEIQKHREEEKREKRVLSNWTSLVRGLLIKERLKKKFNLEDKLEELPTKDKVKAKKGGKATDVQHAWPAAKQHGNKAQQEKPPSQPVHFTVETM